MISCSPHDVGPALSGPRAATGTPSARSPPRKGPVVMVSEMDLHDGQRIVREVVHDPGGLHVDGQRSRGGERRALARRHVSRRGDERAGANREAGASKLGAEKRRAGKMARGASTRCCAAHCAIMRSPGTSSGASAPATPTSATAVCSSRRAASFAPERRRAISARADDGVGTAEGEGLDPQGRKDLELSRCRSPRLT